MIGLAVVDENQLRVADEVDILEKVIELQRVLWIIERRRKSNGWKIHEMRQLHRVDGDEESRGEFSEAQVRIIQSYGLKKA